MRLLRFIFILVVYFMPLLVNANNDSIRKRFPDKSIFVGLKWGDDTLNVYRGRHTDINFNQTIGYFKFQGEEIDPMFVRIDNGALDTFFLNDHLWVNTKIYEMFTQDRYLCFLTDGITLPEFVRSKYYDYSQNKWFIQTRSEDYVSGHRYDSSLDQIDDLSESYKMDTYFTYLIFAILVGGALWAVFVTILSDDRWPKISSDIIMGILILTIVAPFVIDNWMQLQLLWPLLSFLLLFLLASLYKSRSIKITIFHLSLSFLMVLGWGYFQFYSLDSQMQLSNGETIQIHWRKGTDWIKRYVVKRILSNMVPVRVTDHNTTYTIYASKYEFTEGEMSVLNDNIMGWISYLTNDDALTMLSFREAQLIIQKIENLSGVKLDFFTYPEWQSASLGTEHACHENELESVDIGTPNKYGLINIAGNAPEFTSSYYPTIKLGINADTLIGAVNNVYVAGSAYVSNTPANYSLVNKNLKEGGVGLRLVLRPNGIGARKFYVKGHKCSNNKDAKYPSEILITSIDGRLITSFPNYESFEEYLIEHHHDSKHLEVFNPQTKKNENIVIPPGFGFYDLIPFFVFEGIDNENATINI